jgi:hypothetical protein
MQPMDFLDPKKKRAHKIKLYIGYVLMAIALGIGTFILVFAAYGYDVDRHTGDIIQNGLIIIDAHPESATILVNGDNKGSTNNRLILPADKYAIELQRDGYRSWSHTVNLEGSSIEQLVYPFLFPTKLVSKTVQEYAAVPSMASESPDRHWLVIQQPNSASAFSSIDLTNAKNTVVTINLPSDTFTAIAGAHTYEAVEWSADNTHLLLKHTFSGGSEFIMLNRDNPVGSINLNKIFSTQPFTTASLRDKKADQLYLFNGANGNLFQADTKTKIAGLLVSSILGYKTYQDNTVIYTTNPAANSKDIEVHVLQNNQDRLLRTLPIADLYLLDMAQFNGHFYLLCGSPADGHVYVYKDPFDDLNRRPSRTPQPFRVLIVPAAQYVSFSTIARFVAIQGGSNFAVYDFEMDRQFRYDTKLPLVAGQKASWMDGHRLSLISDNAVNIFDFDGTNMQKLSTSLPAFTPFFERDYTAMFTLAPLADKTALVRTELKVLPAGQTP